MKKLTAAMELREAISLLESEQKTKGLILKEHLYITYDSLRPINILRRTLQEVSSSPHLVDNILGVAMGISSGFLSRRIFVGSSVNGVRKLIGSILQYGVTSAVAQHPPAIKSIGKFIMQFLRRRREMKPESNDS